MKDLKWLSKNDLSLRVESSYRICTCLSKCLTFQSEKYSTFFIIVIFTICTIGTWNEKLTFVSYQLNQNWFLEVEYRFLGTVFKPPLLLRIVLCKYISYLRSKNENVCTFLSWSGSLPYEVKITHTNFTIIGHKVKEFRRYELDRQTNKLFDIWVILMKHKLLFWHGIFNFLNFRIASFFFVFIFIYNSFYKLLASVMPTNQYNIIIF